MREVFVKCKLDVMQLFRVIDCISGERLTPVIVSK